MSIKSSYPTDSPSLVLDFANSRRLDPRITFSRPQTGNIATYMGSDGYVKYAGPDEPRFDHKAIVRENLFPYSQQLDLAVTSGVIKTADATTAPDGTLTAERIVETAAFSQHNVQKGALTGPGVHTMSIYAKHYSGDRVLRLATYHATNSGLNVDSIALFDLRNGQRTHVTSGATSSAMEYVGDGWYRCSVTTGDIGTTTGVYYGLSNPNGSYDYLGDGASGLYFWGAQVEKGSVATDYIQTTSTSAIDTKIESRGLLLEKGGTNFITNSNFTSGWNNNNVGASTASIIYGNTTEVVSPDGTNNAAKIEQANNGWQRVAIGVTTVTNNVHTWSVFVKYGNSPMCLVEFTGAWSLGGRVQFNFDTESFEYDSGRFSNVNFIKYPNGWYKIYGSWTATSTSGTNGVAWFFPGDDYNGLPTSPASYTYAWGFQIEEGEIVTSHIPTTTATIARSNEYAQIDGISDFFNPNAGSCFVEFEVNYEGLGHWASYERPFAFRDTSNGREFGISANGNTNQTSVAGYGHYGPGGSYIYKVMAP